MADPHWASVQLALHLDESPFVDLKGHTLTHYGPGRSTVQKAPLAANIYSWDKSTDTSGWMDTPAATEFRLGAGAFTISFYAYKDNTGDVSIMGCWDANIPRKGFYILLLGVGQVQFSGHDAAGSRHDMITAGGPWFNLNQWNHFEISSNGTTWRTRINGVTRGTQTAVTISDPPTTELFFVGRAGYAQPGFTGYIDDVLVTVGVQRNAADFTPPDYPFQTDAPGSLAWAPGTSSASGVNPAFSAVGTATGTSTASAAHAKAFGAGNAQGTSTAAATHVPFGAATATGEATVAAEGRLVQYKEGVARVNGWSVATMYPFRDKGVGYSFGSSSAVAYNLMRTSKGIAVGGASVVGYNPTRTAVGTCLATSSATGINPYRRGRGVASGLAHVTGRSRQSARGVSTGTSSAQARSVSPGRGLSSGDSLALAASARSYGTGVSVGTSAVQGTSYPMRVYPEEVGNRTFVRVPTRQSIVRTEL